MPRVPRTQLSASIRLNIYGGASTAPQEGLESALVLGFSTFAQGSARLEVVGDDLERVVLRSGGAGVSWLADVPVRLRLVLGGRGTTRL